MAVPATRTWTIDPNNAFTSAISMDTQYKEACFNFKDTLINAGWTVIRSSNGTVADGTDNWTTDADVNFGASGTGSWIQLRSPAGWLPNSGTVELLFYVNDTAGTPQQAEIKLCVFGYRDGGVTTLPTAKGTESTINTSGRNIVPWAAAIAGNWTSWYSSRGDVMFIVKGDGEAFIRHCFAISSNVDADGGGDGDQRWFFFSRSFTSNIFINGTHLSFTYWRGPMPSGTEYPNVEANSILTNVTSWTVGEDFSNNSADAKLKIWSDHSERGRYFGEWVDVRAAPGSTVFNEPDDSEGAQDPRRVAVGELWFYMPASEFPAAFD